jgi:protein-disulfide isomerase
VRFLPGFLLLCALTLPAQEWQTATKLADVDLSGLNDSQLAATLKMVRESDCNCGCNLKIAECRVKDPQCSYSKALANTVAAEFRAGKTTEQAFARLAELQKQGPVRPKLLEAAVPLDVAGAPSVGPANAKITIVEFSDFQCPYCALAAPKAMALAKQYPNDVRVVFKQFPLEMHSNAALAAEASMAAHAQGKFWPMHDKMFSDFRAISREKIFVWARESGLDMKTFEADLQSGKYREAVKRDLQQGLQAGVMGTPTFFLNGQRYNGPFEVQVLSQVIDASLKAGAQPAAAKQVPPPAAQPRQN